MFLQRTACPLIGEPFTVVSRQKARKANLRSKLHRLQRQEQKTKYHVSYCHSQKKSALFWEQDKKWNLPSILINHGPHSPYCLCLHCSYKIGI